MLACVNRMRDQDSDDALPLDALAEALGGFELRDERLVLDRAPGIALEGGAARIASCVGIDGDGRAALVVRGTRAESVLLAIDALAWCDARGDLLARRLGARSDGGARVVLIVDEPDDATRDALATLRTADLRVFEARTLQSAQGSHSDLVEVYRPDAGAGATAGAAWESRLEASARALLEHVRAGVSRIDPEATSAAAGRAIVWRSGAARLVELRAPRGRLEAHVRGESFDVIAATDVERVLEGALLALSDSDELGAAQTGAEHVAPAHVDLLPRGPLLSADELAALRGD